MNISFTREQYRTLLLLTLLGELVAGADRPEGEIPPEIHELTSYLRAHAAVFGAEDLVEPGEDPAQYVPSPALEDLALPFLDTYDNNVFWDELTYRLAERDNVRKQGERTWMLLEDEVRNRTLSPLREQYYAEFEVNGIDNLVIVNRNVN